MEQAIVFGLSAGLGFWALKNQVTAAVPGPHPLGLNTITAQNTAQSETIYTPPSGFGYSFAEESAKTPALLSAHKDLITTTRFDQRHPVIDPTKHQPEQIVGYQQDFSLPDMRRWTRPWK